MNSRERFQACCQGKTLDRAPIDYLAHHELDRRLKTHLGVNSEIELLDALGSDFFYLPARDLSQREDFLPYYKHVDRLELAETERTCPLGIRWRREVRAAKFSVDEALRGPLQDTTDPQDILRFPWPRAADFDFGPLRAIAGSQRSRVRVGGFWTGILGDAYRMHGYQNFLTNLGAEPRFAHTLVDRLTEMYLELNDALFAALAGELEVWFFGNDFGTQDALLMSPSMWRDFYFDNIRKLTALAHSYGLKVMMHSCGAVRPLIPLFIEAGVDILDPIQVAAKGMDLASLAAEFGDQVVFHGGIDTQHLLPQGSPKEVVEAVRAALELFEGHGNFILAPSQILGTDIPLENVLAMYRAAAAQSGLDERLIEREHHLAPFEKQVSGMALATGSGWDAMPAASAVPLTGHRTVTSRTTPTTNHWQQNIEQRVLTFEAFHRRVNPRPVFGFFRGSEYPLPRYPFSRRLPEGRPLRPEDFGVDAFVADSVRLFLDHEACGGDFIYSGSAYWGIPWLEAMLGCPIFANHATGSIYAEPPACFTLESLPAFSARNPWSRLMDRMLRALAAASGGRFPLATTRMRGVADLIAALYGGDAFVLALVDNPGEVRLVAQRVTDLFIACGRFQLQRIPAFHGGIGSFYYHAWMPAGTVWHQEDAAALLSPKLYAEFIEPFDRQIVAAFPHVVMHQHSTGFVPTDRYLAMGMSVLELHIDSGGPSAESLFDRHMAILRERPLIIWGDIPRTDLDWLFAKLPPQGLAIITVVNTPDQAQDLWRTYVENHRL